MGQTEQATEEVTTTPPEVKQEVAKQSQPPMTISNGIVTPDTVEQQFRLAKMYIASRVLPERFKTPEQVVAAMHYAAEHFPTTTITALRQIAVINGTPCMFGDLPLALVQRSPVFVSKRDFLIDKDGNEISYTNKNLTAEVWGAVCITKRKTPTGEVDEHTTVFTYTDADLAGLSGKGVWKAYPKRMLQMRARSQNLKDNFADCLNGAGIAEYDANGMAELPDSLRGRRRTAADKMNEDYLEEVEAIVQ